ncbi:nitrilase-related carbon-nitrogen hydrolase, partial [bacterium]
TIDAKKHSIAILQGNINRYMPVGNDYESMVYARYESLLKSLTTKPDLIVWPSNSFPGVYEKNQTGQEWLKKLITNSGTFHIIGSSVLKNNEYYDSTLFFDSSGNELNRTFREITIPFYKKTPLWSVSANISNDRFFSFNSSVFNITTCYEIMFAHRVRKYALAGSNFIINQTDDALALNTAVPRHNIIACIFRAIENRRFVLRAAKNSLSAIINHKGKIINILPVFQKGIIEGSTDSLIVKTFYTQYGDVFAYICLLILFFVIYIFMIKKQKK